MVHEVVHEKAVRGLSAEPPPTPAAGKRSGAAGTPSDLQLKRGQIYIYSQSNQLFPLCHLCLSFTYLDRLRKVSKCNAPLYVMLPGIMCIVCQIWLSCRMKFGAI